ncbi:MAG: hypothetical protein HGA78_03090, partial [Nitrospirales bacterium]|nr:hypothetical protein [Nitrospirales bacterium]
MLRLQPSIKGKIILGYSVTLALIIGLCIITFLELLYMEKKVTSGEVISEFFDTTLEVRRFEKNFFLYSQESDHSSAMEQLSRAEKLLRENRKGFEDIALAETIQRLSGEMQQYRGLMNDYSVAVLRSAPQEKQKQLEGEIR